MPDDLRDRGPLVMAAWQAAYGRMTNLAPGSVDHDQAANDVDRLRGEYLLLADGLVPATLDPDDELMVVVRRYLG